MHPIHGLHAQRRVDRLRRKLLDLVEDRKAILFGELGDPNHPAMHRLVVGPHGDGSARCLPGQPFKRLDDFFCCRPGALLSDGLFIGAFQTGPGLIGTVCRIIGIALTIQALAYCFIGLSAPE